MTIDSLGLTRIDLIKIDVEGMELEALEGGKAAIARCQPILIVETVKTDKTKLRGMLQQLGYRLFEIGMNVLAVHESDKTLSHVKTT